MDLPTKMFNHIQMGWSSGIVSSACKAHRVSYMRDLEAVQQSDKLQSKPVDF